MRSISRLILLFCVSMTFQQMQAQIWLTSDSTLYFGEKDYNSTTDHGIRGWWNVNRYPGMYWSNPGNKFLLLDVSSVNPRIAGSGNSIYFRYGTVYYDTIYVDRCIARSSSLAMANSDHPVNDVVSMLKPMRNATGEYSFDPASLQQACPDAVKMLDGGEAGIAYEKFIPLLLRDIELLDKQTNTQGKDLERIQHTEDYEITPMNGSVLISYRLPSECREAYLQLCDEDGAEVKKVNISGTSALQLYSSELKTQNGYVSFVIDRKYRGTKKICFPER